MAIALDNSGGVKESGTVATISDFVVGAGTNRCLIAFTNFRLDQTHVTEVKFGSTQFTNLIASANYTCSYDTWYLKNPDVTTADLVANTGGSDPVGQNLAVISLNGVDLDDSFSNYTALPNGDFTDYGIDITTEAANSWVVGAVMPQTANYSSMVSDYTDWYNEDSTPGMFCSYRTTTTTGTYTLTWSGSGSSGAYCHHIEVKEAAAAAGRRRMLTMT